MRLSPRRALLTLLVAGSIVLGGPALGYAQQQHSADEARYGPAPGSPDAAGHTALSPSGSFDLHEDGNDTVLAFANDDAYGSDNAQGDD
jgi:hypothetical protein